MKANTVKLTVCVMGLACSCVCACRGDGTFLQGAVESDKAMATIRDQFEVIAVEMESSNVFGTNEVSEYGQVGTRVERTRAKVMADVIRSLEASLHDPDHRKTHYEQAHEGHRKVIAELNRIVGAAETSSNNSLLAELLERAQQLAREIEGLEKEPSAQAALPESLDRHERAADTAKDLATEMPKSEARTLLESAEEELRDKDATEALEKTLEAVARLEEESRGHRSELADMHAKRDKLEEMSRKLDEHIGDVEKVAKETDPDQAREKSLDAMVDMDTTRRELAKLEQKTAAGEVGEAQEHLRQNKPEEAVRDLQDARKDIDSQKESLARQAEDRMTRQQEELAALNDKRRRDETIAEFQEQLAGLQDRQSQALSDPGSEKTESPGETAEEPETAPTASATKAEQPGDESSQSKDKAQHGSPPSEDKKAESPQQSADKAQSPENPASGAQQQAQEDAPQASAPAASGKKDQPQAESKQQTAAESPQKQPTSGAPTPGDESAQLKTDQQTQQKTDASLPSPSGQKAPTDTAQPSPQERQGEKAGDSARREEDGAPAQGKKTPPSGRMSQQARQSLARDMQALSEAMQAEGIERPGQSMKRAAQETDGRQHKAAEESMQQAQQRLAEAGQQQATGKPGSTAQAREQSGNRPSDGQDPSGQPSQTPSTDPSSPKAGDRAGAGKGSSQGKPGAQGQSGPSAKPGQGRMNSAPASGSGGGGRGGESGSAELAARKTGSGWDQRLPERERQALFSARKEDNTPEMSDDVKKYYMNLAK
ncbi:MAG: hypothetical protein HQ559_10385 [Lentisphaerae bacterium]|nr:hypothetical protein [Lentisphaerota bacterium]